MAMVIVEQSMSLDGRSAWPNISVGNPLGDGGELLHEWMSRDGGAEIAVELFRSCGAVVVGRGMFDLGVDPWGADPPFHNPMFVVTHGAHDPHRDSWWRERHPPGPWRRSGGRVADSPHSTAPVGGNGLFEAARSGPTQMEVANVVPLPWMTHLTFRLARG